MTQLLNDIERYTGFKEFAQDGLYSCHPNDEARFKTLIAHYDAVISSLENLSFIFKQQEQQNVFN